MAYTTNPYCEVGDVQAALNLTSFTTNDASFVQTLITEAQDFVDSELGHSFQTDGSVSVPATRLFDGRDTDKLWVGEFTSFSQVLETTTITLLVGNNWVQVASNPSDITADCLAGPYDRGARALPYLWLKRVSGLPFLAGIQNFTVKGVFGNPAVPPAISRACVRLAVHWYRQRATNYASAVSSAGQVTQHYKQSIPDDVMEILAQYRRRHFTTGR